MAREFLSRLYACPDEAYHKAFQEEMDQFSKATPPEGEQEAAAVLTADDRPTLKLLADQYGSLLAETAFDRFLSQNIVSKYQEAAIRDQWTSEPVRIDITYEGRGKYTYAAIVSVTDALTKTTEQEVRGTVEFDDAGRINWFSEYDRLLP